MKKNISWFGFFCMLASAAAIGLSYLYLRSGVDGDVVNAFFYGIVGIWAMVIPVALRASEGG